MDIGIDLGTSNVIITMEKKGIILNEPSIVTYNRKRKLVTAAGETSYRMLGKTPPHLTTIRPIACGVISDEDMAKCMIKEYVHRAIGHQPLKPQIIVCVPPFITEVERRAVTDAAMVAGARKVHLIQEPIAALMGAGIDIGQARGSMIVDIGGGTTDVAVVSLNGIVISESIKIGGIKIDDSIIKYLGAKYKVSIGERTAEHLKMTLANVFSPYAGTTAEIKGKCLNRGLPIRFEVTQVDVFEAIRNDVLQIMELIRHVLDSTPPELVSDISEKGITLTGGCALLGGLEPLIEDQLKVRAEVAHEPLLCVAKGTRQAYKNMANLLDGFKQMRVISAE
jgi:rod shape-determining protein MreB